MKMKEPTVYLLQEPTDDKDLSSAAKYGKIVPVISNQEKPALNTAAAIANIRKAMTNYEPKIDYICFAGGDPIVLMLTGIELERLGIKEIQYLIWNRARTNGQRTGAGFYLPKIIFVGAMMRRESASQWEENNELHN